MTKAFHKNEFDYGTQVKLAIFRGYIREWISVFLTGWKEGIHPEVINLWDFFAGPGTDTAGNPGSPRIIQDELKDYCQAREDIKAHGLQVRLNFNDKSKKHIAQLQQCLAENACPKKCCQPIFSSKPFQDSFAEYQTTMGKPRTANLVIMDQFGVKEVTPDVVKTLSGLRATDILYRFTLQKGFLPKHAKKNLARLQKAGQLEALDPASGMPLSRVNAFYLTWDHFKEGKVQAVFRLKE